MLKSPLNNLVLVWLLTASLSNFLFADGPADNNPQTVRAVPPVGIELTSEDAAFLHHGLTELNSDLEKLRSTKSSLNPDVEIFARAIRDALTHRELYSQKDIANAKAVLNEGRKRATALLEDKPYWTMQTGLVVRGFRSRIDQTVQPYGLVVPGNYSNNGTDRVRLDLWFHGRGERSSESVFIAERMQKIGRFAPVNTIVLHPYGRYSNAFKFAGEIDVLEALEHAKANYRIDEDRISVRGFSMGGAGCWQMAVHYPDLFFAANPGAGFSETPEFLKSFQKETLTPTWFEKKLWTMYDCPGYAINLSQLPTIAYSGELDIQKQAADVMESALAEHGMRLMHVIGAKTKHTIDDASKSIIESKLATLARSGRERVPHELHFATYTLKYNRCHWLAIDALSEHWRQARVDATIDASHSTINIRTKNVEAFTINFAAGDCPFSVSPNGISVVWNTTDKVEQFDAGQPFSDRSFEFSADNRNNSDHTLVKRHDLQGPIDDAFMDSFLVVTPTGPSDLDSVSDWASAEQQHFIHEWRRQFRGDAVYKPDEAVTDADIANNNLILFGTPQTNSILRRIKADLPIKWDGTTNFVMSGKTYDAKHFAPILIYPNPLNPNRYVVINSGFTYREYAYLNNARQVAKLPDWAVIDIRTPADSLWPGKVVDAGFFDESWQFKNQ